MSIGLGQSRILTNRGLKRGGAARLGIDCLDRLINCSEHLAHVVAPGMMLVIIALPDISDMMNN